MKTLFLILVAIIASALLVAAVLPKNFKIEQEIVINKPRVVVFDYLKMTKTNNDWNPFSTKDPTEPFMVQLRPTVNGFPDSNAVYAYGNSIMSSSKEGSIQFCSASLQK